MRVTTEDQTVPGCPELVTLMVMERAVTGSTSMSQGQMRQMVPYHLAAEV